MKAWPIAALGDIFEIARGGSPRPIDDFITDDPAGINWIMISDASEGSKYINSTRKRIRLEGARRSRKVKPGDFLLTNSMSFGKPYIMRTEGCIHDGWLVMSPRSRNADADFFYHLLGSKIVYAEFERRASGATVKNLNIDLVRGVTVPLPPLAEQRRIAEILDKADALRAKRRAVLAQLDTLTQSIFLDMFGDPATNPKGWPTVPFSDLLDGIESGSSPICLDRQALPEEWGVLKLGAITWCEYDDAENKALPSDVVPIAAHEVHEGDLLFARKNTYELVGACAFVRTTRSKLLLPDLIFRFRLPRDGPIEKAFLHRLLIHPSKRHQVRRLAGGSAGSMPNISKSRLANLMIEVPPQPLQRTFAKCVESVERSKATQRTWQAQADDLFASLQHRAFRGEL